MTTEPADIRWIDRADVYKGDQLAGYLIREGSDIAFAYDDDYRLDARSQAVAWTIPLGDNPARASGGSVPRSSPASYRRELAFRRSLPRPGRPLSTTSGSAPSSACSIDSAIVPHRGSIASA